MSAPTLAHEKLIDIVRLIRTPGVGPITFFNLLQRYRNCTQALAALPELSRRGGRKMPLVAISQADAEKEIAACEAFGARMIAYGAPDYPALLLTIPDPPPIITILGSPHVWQGKKLAALVGARNASAGGCQFAHKLAKELGMAGFTTVSGLARGIDTFVHKGSLLLGTIAVVAGGIDHIYPPENAELYQQIRDTGAIMSDQPFGQVPFAASFPSRNRIIAGISAGTIVVEASPQSGSLITARLAGEYNREVFAVPGSPLDPRSKGCNQLIRQGAHMVESVSDIVEHLSMIPHKQFYEKQTSNFTSIPLNDNELANAREKIIEKLGAYAVSIDELVEQCDTSAAIVQTVILELELAGRVARRHGNKVCLSSYNEEMV